MAAWHSSHVLPGIEMAEIEQGHFIEMGPTESSYFKTGIGVIVEVEKIEPHADSYDTDTNVFFHHAPFPGLYAIGTCSPLGFSQKDYKRIVLFSQALQMVFSQIKTIFQHLKTIKYRFIRIIIIII